MRVYFGQGGQIKNTLLNLSAHFVEKGCRVLVLVPEMATLETERMILEGLHWPGSFQLQVMSPSRLSERVFEREGMGAAAGHTVIGDQGKNMAVAGALLKMKKELTYYGGAAQRSGFIAKMGAFIADLKRSGLTGEKVAEYASSLPEGAYRDKMTDVGQIYTAYQDFLQGRFVDGEDVQEAMLSKLEESDMAENTCVIALGFDILTQQFSKVLCALQRKAQEVCVLLKRQSGADAFEPVLQSVGRLEKMCREKDLTLQRLWMEKTVSKKPAALRFIEEEYLKDGVFSGDLTPVRLYAGAAPYFEMTFIAREMKKLHMQGMKYQDMALAMCSFEEYAPVVESVFESYDIPCYIPRKLSCITHGAARFLISSLRALSMGLDAENMIDLLQSGYAQVTGDMAWRLENYITGYGIKGRRFLRPFDRGDSELCASLEESRRKLAEPLWNMREKMKAAACTRDQLTAVYDYLADCRIYEKIMEKEELLLQNHLPSQAAQGRQVWGTLMKLLDQMHELFKDEHLSALRMAEILETGLSESQLSSLPPDGGSVMCLEVGGMAGRSVRALFICGLQDGTLTPSGDGLISDEEKSQLENAADCYISLDADGKDDLKKLDFYHTLCMADEKLVLSRAMASQAGEAKRPHLYLGRVRRMFPLLVEEGGVRGTEETQEPLSPVTAARELVVRFSKGETDGIWQDAWKYLCQHEKDLAGQVQSSFHKEDEYAPLTREVTKKLFLERVMSVSRLETFAACPYQHFVRYGLKPVEKKEWKILSQDAGSFYHAALEGFTRLLPSVPKWPNIQRKVSDEFMDKVSGELLESQFGELLSDSPRVRTAAEKYVKVLRRVAWAFTRGAQHSAFMPAGSEVSFGYPDENSLPPVELTLHDGQRVLLRGKIDRIDRYQGDEGVYLRVVDYKSGNKELSPTQIFYGQQLQLLLYLLAAVQGERGSYPAGAYYFHLQDPLIEDPYNMELAEMKLAEKLHLQGVTLKDAAIIRLMDDDNPPLTLPRLLKADGDFAAGKQLADLDDMRRLVLFARDTACDLCESMRKGAFEARPLQENGRSPCDFCQYAPVCRRENARPQAADKLTFDELLDKINALDEERRTKE